MNNTNRLNCNLLGWKSREHCSKVTEVVSCANIHELTRVNSDTGIGKYFCHEIHPVKLQRRREPSQEYRRVGALLQARLISKLVNQLVSGNYTIFISTLRSTHIRPEVGDIPQLYQFAQFLADVGDCWYILKNLQSQKYLVITRELFLCIQGTSSLLKLGIAITVDPPMLAWSPG